MKLLSFTPPADRIRNLKISRWDSISAEPFCSCCEAAARDMDQRGSCVDAVVYALAVAFVRAAREPGHDGDGITFTFDNVTAHSFGAAEEW